MSVFSEVLDPLESMLRFLLWLPLHLMIKQSSNSIQLTTSQLSLESYKSPVLDMLLHSNLVVKYYIILQLCSHAARHFLLSLSMPPEHLFPSGMHSISGSSWRSFSTHPSSRQVSFVPRSKGKDESCTHHL